MGEKRERDLKKRGGAVAKSAKALTFTLLIAAYMGFEGKIYFDYMKISLKNREYISNMRFKLKTLADIPVHVSSPTDSDYKRVRELFERKKTPFGAKIIYGNPVNKFVKGTDVKYEVELGLSSVNKRADLMLFLFLRKAGILVKLIDYDKYRATGLFQNMDKIKTLKWLKKYKESRDDYLDMEGRLGFPDGKPPASGKK